MNAPTSGKTSSPAMCSHRYVNIYAFTTLIGIPRLTFPALPSLFHHISILFTIFCTTLQEHVAITESNANKITTLEAGLTTLTEQQTEMALNMSVMNDRQGRLEENLSNFTTSMLDMKSLITKLVESHTSSACPKNPTAPQQTLDPTSTVNTANPPTATPNPPRPSTPLGSRRKHQSSVSATLINTEAEIDDISDDDFNLAQSSTRPRNGPSKAQSVPRPSRKSTRNRPQNPLLPPVPPSSSSFVPFNASTRKALRSVSYRLNLNLPNLLMFPKCIV